MSSVPPNESAVGKVNNLIGFFEELNDENPNTNFEIKQNHYQSQNDKQSVIMQYFSNGCQNQQEEKIGKDNHVQQVNHSQETQDYYITGKNQYEQFEQTQQCRQTQEIEQCQQTQTQEIEQCQQTQTQEIEPCQQTQTYEIEPCQQTQTYENEPCQQTQTYENEPCQQTQTYENEPCQQTQTQDIEPCQLTQTQDIEPCQLTQTQDIEPCQLTQTQDIEPCQLTQSQDIEPCQLTQSQDIEPCQLTQTQDIEPCQLTQTQDIEPCQLTQTQDIEPCQLTQTHEIESCQQTEENKQHGQSHQNGDLASHHYGTLPKHLTGHGVPTICSAGYFDPEEDAHGLKKAMKGLGTNEKLIIKILTQRSAEQRQIIAVKYTELFGKNLTQELRKELSGDFESIIVSLMSTKYKFLAKELRKATKGIGTNEDSLIEILCSYNDEELRLIQETYHYLYSHELKDDIYGDTSGQLRKIFLSILAASRMDSNSLTPEDLAKQLAETDDKGKPTITSDVMRTLLVTYTRATLFMTFDYYESLTGKSIEELIKSIASKDVERALIAIHDSIVSLPVFYAEQLYHAMKGSGTKEDKLTRIIVSRSENDLQDIIDDFYKMTGKNLADEVKSETSGNYQTALLAIIEGGNSGNIS